MQSVTNSSFSSTLCDLPSLSSSHHYAYLCVLILLILIFATSWHHALHIVALFRLFNWSVLVRGGGAQVNFGPQPKKSAVAKQIFSKVPEKISFYPQNFLMTFLVIDRKLQ